MRMKIEEAEEIFGKYFFLRQAGYDHKNAAKEVGARGKRVNYLGYVYSFGFSSIRDYEKAQRKKRAERVEARIFGALLKERLKTLGISAYQLAKKLGVSHRQVSAYTGLHKFPSERTRENIYPFLDIDETHAEELLDAAISGRLEDGNISNAVASVLGGKSASGYFKLIPGVEGVELRKRESTNPPRKEKNRANILPTYQSAIRAAPDKTAGVVITLDKMKLAIKASTKMDSEGAESLAQYVMNFFGYSGVMIDNILAAEDRDLFYTLEDNGLLRTEKEETTLYDGREWRIHYWLLKKERILELSKSSVEQEVGSEVEEDETYRDVPNEDWIGGLRKLNATETAASD